MRPINYPNIIANAEGSILYQSGKTEVICTATFGKVPEWLTKTVGSQLNILCFPPVHLLEFKEK